MSGKFEFKVDLPKRTVYIRMTGHFDEPEMKGWVKAYRTEATDRFKGQKHMIIADMRGMKPTSPQVAQIMGAEIGHARKNGVVLCAHISDDTVQRLQAARIGRQNSDGDDVTVDVVSLSEAYLVCAEARNRIDDATPIASIREPLSLG